jgi:RNA polymerase sigma factor (sigma-70 family)
MGWRDIVHKSNDEKSTDHSDANSRHDYEMHIARLFEEHNQNLLRFVTARLHSPQEAKEIAQEAYVRLLNLDEPDSVSYMRAYLFRIAANLVVDRLKQRERRSELRNLAFFDEEVSSPPPESILNAHDELRLIQNAISELPPKCRKAFLLHKIHSISIKKTAEEMNLSTRMVRIYVARAVAFCKERLEQAEATGK